MATVFSGFYSCLSDVWASMGLVIASSSKKTAYTTARQLMAVNAIRRAEIAELNIGSDVIFLMEMIYLLRDACCFLFVKLQCGKESVGMVCAIRCSISLTFSGCLSAHGVRSML